MMPRTRADITKVPDGNLPFRSAMMCEPISQAEYYGQNKYASESNNKWGTGGHNYAQGWSFIYFLRTGKKANAKGWDPKWDGILEAYLRELAMTNSTEKAVDKAFADIDMDALEKAWLTYTN